VGAVDGAGEVEVAVDGEVAADGAADGAAEAKVGAGEDRYSGWR
jgi:hypothetical protein